MGFYENGLERVAAISVSSASMALGGLGAPGALETSIGLAGLAGFVLGKNKKFGPECSRVQKRIRQKLLSDYGDFIKIEGDEWYLATDLDAANEALNATLADCFIDRKKLAASAVTVSGFRDGAVALIFGELAQKHPALFAANKSDTIAYRYAQDVIRAGVEAAVEDPDYYRKLEPLLMLEMASTLGIVHAAVDAIRDDIRSLQSTIDALVKQGENRAREFGIKEGLLLGLARRYAPSNPENFDTALKELERALDVAHREFERDALPSNIDAALDAVFSRVDELNELGELDNALAAIDAEIAKMDEEAARSDAARARLYEKGLAQAILTRSVEGVVRFLLAGIELDSDGKDDGLERLQTFQNEWFERGRDKGLNFDLEVAISLAFRLLEEYARERVPLDWAMTQNNLGKASLTFMSKISQRKDQASMESHRRAGLEHVENALSVLNAESSPAYYEEATSVREKLLAF